MSGAIDYLLRVVIPNIKAYDPFYKKLSISCLYDKILIIHYRFEKMSFFMIVRPFDDSRVLLRVVIPNIKAYDPFYKKLSISCLYDKILIIHYRFEKMSFFMIVRPFDDSRVLLTNLPVADEFPLILAKNVKLV